LPTDRKPFVSIIMPALNEERYVSAAIDSVIPCSHDIEFELLVLDGGSTDRTREIVQAIAAEDRRVRLIHNGKRIQSAGVNLAAKLADVRARYLLRADCHVGYPQGFVERCIRSLEQHQVASVVVPMRAEGSTCVQRAIAAAQNSRLGNGGSLHRVQGRSGLVEHGHHAAFDRDVFLELGGYDEAFTHNEDAEFDKRLIKSGRRIYLDAEAAVTYYPRADFRSLARQYFNHGSGRARTFLKHGGLPSLRQMLPVAALLGCLLSLALAVVDPAFSAIAAVYVLACLAWGLGLALQQRQACVALSGVAALVMHMSWGVGFLRRVLGGARCAPLVRDRQSEFG
jgi:succinoglycan biosynthesis protein ExoA